MNNNVPKGKGASAGGASSVAVYEVGGGGESTDDADGKVRDDFIKDVRIQYLGF